MVQSINVTVLLAIASAWLADGFLFTPKFQLFLSQMKQAGHQDFAYTWDVHKQNCYKPNKPAANPNGKNSMGNWKILNNLNPFLS